jgi:hypothetical protein
MKRRTPKGLIPIDIKSAQNAIKRHNTNAVKASQEEIKKVLSEAPQVAPAKPDVDTDVETKPTTPTRRRTMSPEEPVEEPAKAIAKKIAQRFKQGKK